MAPTIQAQHIVAVTIPTIAVLFFTYLWYKKRSNSIARSRNDPGGGGGTSRKRARHRNSSTATSVAAANAGNGNSVGNSTACVESRETFPEAMKNAMQKAIRDLETASPIQEVCSDSEENQSQETETSHTPMNKSVLTEAMLQEEISSPLGTETSVRQNDANTNVKNDDSKDLCDTEASTGVDGESMEKSIVESNLGDTAAACGTEGSIVEKRKNSESEKLKLNSGGTCCNPNRHSNGVSDDLDVAMLKLESMRINDNKSKRKQTGEKAKRQNYLAKDSDNLISSSTNADTNKAASRGKSPTKALSPTASSAPSKARKRRAKKRLKAQQRDDGDEVKSPGSEITTETTTTCKKTTCDSNNKNIEFCGSRTNVKDMKHSTRNKSSDIEKTSLDSRENDRLSCSIKESKDCDLKVIENHQKDCDNERDSANHSPVDTILDCQSVQFSDAHSEGSSDSGKGCSEGAVSPSPQTPAGGSSISGDQNVVLWYQFVIPQEHVGKLIGKQGQFINTVKSRSNTRIFIKKHPTSYKKKICALEGTQADINKALEMIRNRFPEETYQDLTLEEFPVAHQPIMCPLRSELLHLDLVEGVNNDVVISSVVTAGHLFLQQPMHPSYQSLTILNMNMNMAYNSPEAPLIPKPVKDAIVAAPAMGGWYRAHITAVDEESETCDVRFLDYGGYLTLSSSSLRAVRADFITLPFQAVECFLANIAPINETWCEEAKLVVQGLTYGQILQAQVYDYTPEGIPLILLYVVHGSQVILINDELVARGFAYPLVPNDGAQSEDYYVYS